MKILNRRLISSNRFTRPQFNVFSLFFFLRTSVLKFGNKIGYFSILQSLFQQRSKIIPRKKCFSKKTQIGLVQSIVFAVSLMGACAIFSKSGPVFDINHQANASSNDQAQRRFKAWSNLIKKSQTIPESEKLKKVNQFFNLFHYKRDIYYQGLSDVWKTPEEFIRDGEGDCEDYAIAKYFTLLALEVPMHKLRITYVKSLKLNQAHMVLAYYPYPESEPLILDSLESKILPASKRKDLIPVYSFNTDELWLSRPMGADRYLGVNNLKKWRAVLERMKQGDIKE